MLAISLVAVGDVKADVVAFVAEGLAREFGVDVAATGTLPVPAGAYDPERAQHSSTRILASLSEGDSLGALEGSPEAILVAMTQVDLYVPELNFAFGEARPDERTCIISLARLGPSGAGEPGPGEVAGDLLKGRALTEAIHEIGHILGLGHCSRRDCVMFFSNSIVDTDRKGFRFCEECRQRAAKSC